MHLGPNETGIHTIPPVALLVALLAAWGLDTLMPAALGLPPWLRLAAAILLIGAPVAFVLWLYVSFQRRGSDYDVRKRPHLLVTDGAFRWSRNPGYVAMAVGMVGWTIALDNWWILPATVPAMLWIHHRVVLKEEVLLETTFGDAYRAYKGSVRRWL